MTNTEQPDILIDETLLAMKDLYADWRKWVTAVKSHPSHKVGARARAAIKAAAKDDTASRLSYLLEELKDRMDADGDSEGYYPNTAMQIINGYEQEYGGGSAR